MGPEFIGNYRLLKKLGEGGMGLVWLAEQTAPVHRFVALKLIRTGFYDDSILERFRSEQQSLAVMNHPAIAKVFDAGTTPDGQPYFVMEYVEGSSITRYCDAKNLSIRKRLDLFIKVCEGVQHAHQKAIIHRDLKPSNVLIAEVDGKPVPRIIDFGIAKAISSQASADQTMFTQAGALIGTLGFMSPEQASNLQDIDTRTDVYSLGVILYTLLTGMLPFDGDEWKKRPIDEVLRQLREEDPPSPVTKLRDEKETATAAAERRGTDANELGRLLRGDLDWITMKAVDKDRARRYGTPTELAADIQRYLDNEPVLARPASSAYRLRKYVRRHRAMVAGVAAVFVVLVAGIIASSWQAVRANRAGQAAVVERDRAVGAEAKARTAERMSAEQRDRAVSAEGTANDERNKALAAESQAVEQRNRALREKQRADEEAATSKAVNDFLQRDLLAQASAYNQASPNTRPDPDLNVRTALDRAAARIKGKFDKQPLVEAAIQQTIANAYKDLGLFPDAQPHAERSVELRSKVQGQENQDTLTAMSDLAELYVDQGKLPAGLAVHTKVLESRRRLLGPEHPDTLKSMESVAVVYEKQGQWSQAGAIQSQALEISRRVMGEEHPDTVQAMVNLAIIRIRENQLTQAEALDTKGVEILTRVRGKEHPETLEAMNNLAQVYYQEGKDAEAEALQSKTLEERRRILGEEHPDTLESMNNLAVIYKAEGKYPETEALHSRVLEIKRKVLGDEHPDTLISMNNLAVTYEAEGKYADAEVLLSKNLEIKRRVLGPEHPSGLNTMYNLARVYGEEHKYEEAYALYTTLLDILRRKLGPRHNNTMDTMASLSELEVQKGDYAAAEPLLRETWIGLKETRPEYWRTYYMQSLLGSVLLRQKQYADAEPLLLSGHNGLVQHREAIPLLSRSSVIDAGDWIVQLYRSWGQPAKAAEWQAKLEKDKNNSIATERK